MDHVGRIDALTAAGRANWFALLAYLAFVTVTALGVEDIDFFVDSRQTELPLVGVSIPTFSFFVFAPILGAALYAYLHLHIRKVTEALAEAPAGDPPLEERIRPWLLNDYVLRRRPDMAIRRRPLDGLAGLTTLLLVWWAGPAVLILMWERSWVAHDLWLSALNGACVIVAVYAGVLSFRKMRADLAGRQPRARLATALVLALCGPVAWLTAANSNGVWEWRVGHARGQPDEDRRTAGRIAAWARVEERAEDSSFSHRIGAWLWDMSTAFAELDAPDLSGLSLSVLPPDQADLATARQRYRREYCGRRGIDAVVCDRTPSASYEAPRHVTRAREAWCRDAGYAERTAPGEATSCDAFFAGFEDDFGREWRTFRTALIAAIDKPDFSGRDLRRADLSATDLHGVRFIDAWMEGADLRGARMEGADLRRARMEGADLSEARMEGANLHEARMQRADLSLARMEGVDLSEARMEGAVLTDAGLEGAVLGLARMQGAVLRWARMEGAFLGSARMDGANLTEARMEGALLGLARMEGAGLSGARMEGADLSLARMQGANLRRTRMEGAVLWRANLRSANWAGSIDAPLLAQFADFRGGVALGQSRLSSMIGNARTLLPDTPDPETGAPLFIPSCWTSLPTGWDRLVVVLTSSDVSRMTEAQMREAFLCAPGAGPRKTGTPWPLDEPPPWEADPDWEPEDRGPVD